MEIGVCVKHVPMVGGKIVLTADAQEVDTPGQRWSEVHPRYVEAFGPEAAAIGPPPGR